MKQDEQWFTCSRDGEEFDRAKFDDELRRLNEQLEDWRGSNEARALARSRLPALIEEVARLPLPDAAEQEQLRVLLLQQLALAYYKDDEYVHPRVGHEKALELLHRAGLGERDQDNQCTLCMGGAVHKYLWQMLGRDQDLRAAERYYRKAHEQQTKGRWSTGSEPGLENPGYPGNNYALLLDARAALLARPVVAESGAGGGSDAAGAAAVAGSSEPAPSGRVAYGQDDERERREEARRLRRQADAVRRDVLTCLERAFPRSSGSPGGGVRRNPRLWDILTHAEAHFGLGEYALAEEWLTKAQAAKLAEWQRKSCFSQLVRLAELRGMPMGANDPALRATLPLVDSPSAAHAAALAARLRRGKVGLALSGGGHRAALYHLGVLARLADVGALRDVETISTVSGGSIVGALYYLEVKRLLEGKADHEIDDEDYRVIVRKVIAKYVRGVQENLRMRSIANPWHNVAMLFKSATHSQRLGELYARHFYGGQRSMHELLIAPLGAEGPFNPINQNWRRLAKVPVLMLNATTLNTGHNWHYTATWMGEPPRLSGGEIDKNERLRRAYYTEELKVRKQRRDAAVASEQHSPKGDEVEHLDPKYGVDAPPLGEAVAASAAVPGLFPPITIEGMYEGRTVQLVDGGGHDNQGVEALLAQGCDHLLCSDASGQMADEASPGTGRLGVALRSTSILMDRVREVQYDNLVAREESGSLKRTLFVHLKQDLHTRDIPWTTAPEERPSESLPHLTNYEVDRATQLRLADLRTDLDSFTDVEANALMCSGYLATRRRLFELDDEHRAQGLAGHWGHYDQIDAGGDWPFLGMREVLALPTTGKHYESLPAEDKRRVDWLTRQLNAGSELFFKAWLVSPWLRGLKWPLALLVAALVASVVMVTWNEPLPRILPATVGSLVMTVGLALLAVLVPSASYLLRPQNAARGVLWRFGVATVGFVVAGTHLLLFDPIFKKCGSKKAGSASLFGRGTHIAPGRASILPKAREDSPPASRAA